MYNKDINLGIIKKCKLTKAHHIIAKHLSKLNIKVKNIKAISKC